MPIDELPTTRHVKRTRLLMGVFDFNDDDLAANQQGQLTPRQQRRLRSIANGWIWGSMFFMGIFIIVVLKAAFAMPRPLDIAWLAVVPAIVAIVVAFKIRSLRMAKISIAEGLARHYQVENRTGKGPRIVQYMRLGDAEFYFPVEERELFKQDEPYRIYYLPQSPYNPIIFSVEALRPVDRPWVLVRVKPWCPTEEYQTARRDSLL
jgi:hypothetical protein